MALLLSTSGSTGSTKFVKLSYENIFSNTKNISKYLKLTKKDRSISSLPLNYSYGLSVINTHLYKGGSIFVSERNVIDKKFWEIVNNFKISNLNGVPFFYEILSKIGFEKFNLNSIKFFTQAGGHLNNFVKDQIFLQFDMLLQDL